MEEQLEIFDPNNNSLGFMERKQFYQETKEEFEEIGKITRKIKSIRVLIMNSDGRIYLQKRSNTKNANAGLYDKTVGGHISAGETSNFTVVKECAEELGFPVVVLPTEDFARSVKNLDLSVVGALREVGYDKNFLSTRKTKRGDFIQPFMTNIFVGYYNGPILFKDGESCGVETFSLSELEEEILNNPEKFTEDLKIMVKNYGKFLIPLK